MLSIKDIMKKENQKRMREREGRTYHYIKTKAQKPKIRIKS